MTPREIVGVMFLTTGAFWLGFLFNMFIQRKK